MDPMNKPEWFQITEKDGGKPHRPVRRGIRAFALSIPLLAIGIGVVVAQSSDESPANAETATFAIASAAPSITSNVVQAKPAIATPPLPPTGGEDDDEFEDDDD